MGTVANLLSGTPVVYIAPTGEALPELSDLTPPAVTVTPAGNWSAIGYSMDDFKLRYNPKYEPKKINESNAAVGMALVEEEGGLSFTLAESDLTAFSQAMSAGTLTTVAAGANQTAQDRLAVGDGTPAEKALLILGTSPEGGSRVIHVYKAIRDSAAELTMSKKHQGIPVAFAFLADMTQSAGSRLFKVYDITAVASS